LSSEDFGERGEVGVGREEVEDDERRFFWWGLIGEEENVFNS
jgi:hypothetical protein